MVAVSETTDLSSLIRFERCEGLSPEESRRMDLILKPRRKRTREEPKVQLTRSPPPPPTTKILPPASAAKKKPKKKPPKPKRPERVFNEEDLYILKMYTSDDSLISR